MIDFVKRYLGTRTSLWKLETTERMSLGAGVTLVYVLAGIFALNFFVFLNIALGCYLGEYFGSYGHGFLFLAGIYLLLILIILSLKKTVRNAVANLIIAAISPKI